MVVTTRHRISTSGQGDAHDLTNAASAAVAASGLVAGVITVLVIGSTAAVATIEFEPGAVRFCNSPSAVTVSSRGPQPTSY